MESKDKKIKCDHCGKFISNNDFHIENVFTKFIPDSEFTTEKIIFIHTKCKI